jgi:RNA polymerase sigma-70 factor (ECF subfamily)
MDVNNYRQVGIYPRAVGIYRRTEGGYYQVDRKWRKAVGKGWKRVGYFSEKEGKARKNVGIFSEKEDRGRKAEEFFFGKGGNGRKDGFAYLENTGYLYFTVFRMIIIPAISIRMKKNHIQIRELLRALSLENAEQALKALYCIYSVPVRRYIRMYVRSAETAEELAGDVFLVIWERRMEMQEINDFDAYIFTVAKFKTFGFLRENRPDFIDIGDVPLDVFGHTVTTPEDDFISNEMIEAANRAIELLPPKTKLAFKLIREDGMKYREAAEFMGIAVKTLEGHITAAMKAIGAALNFRK